MASASITTRSTKHGPRYVVRYRLGGRAYPIEHGGSFQTLREARARRDLIGGELAAGRNPGLVLSALTVEAPRAKTLAVWAEQYRASRRDHAPETDKNTGSHLRRILPMLGEQDPAAITWQDVDGFVDLLAADLKPSSVNRYMATLRQLLDYCETDPNPARDRRVKLPPITVEEPQPPTGRQFLAILENVPSKCVLPLLTMEQTAMRIGETCSLAWGDVDVAESRFRLRGRETKTRTARWVQVPAWLMDEIKLTCPLEDRTPERRVFPGFHDHTAKLAMRHACKQAGIPHFHPHDLRHRRITIWHHEGIPARVLADRAGHARASMSLDRYSHVMPPGEVEPEAFQTLLRP